MGIMGYVYACACACVDRITVQAGFVLLRHETFVCLEHLQEVLTQKHLPENTQRARLLEK